MRSPVPTTSCFKFSTVCFVGCNAISCASGKDDAIQLTPATKFSLEQALDFIDDDELVEVTPKEIRLRKKHLTENDRKRASRGG